MGESRCEAYPSAWLSLDDSMPQFPLPILHPLAWGLLGARQTHVHMRVVGRWGGGHT